MNAQAKVASGQDSGKQMRITPEEMALIKSTFLHNEKLLKLMRKMFLPEIDPEAPLGQMIDLYRTIPTKERNPVDVTVDLMARNMVIDHVDGVLLQLMLISKLEPTTEGEVVAKMKADSSK